MTFKFNGEVITIPESISIKEYISSLKIDTNGLIVLLNDEVLDKNEHEKLIFENCNVEVLRFVSGG
nr:sulfur carrier protein ThiS [uncultured Cetobacterium sp.]